MAGAWQDDGRHELGEDLQDVDEGLPGGERVQEGPGNAAVYFIARADDEPPSILRVVLASGPGFGWNVASLVALLPVQEEGVGVDGGLNRLLGREREELGPNVVHEAYE